MIKIIKAVIGYEGLYEITDDGAVFSVDRYTKDGKHLKRKEVKGGKFSNGYEFVCLRKDGVNHNCLKHRLVAEVFIPNPDNLPCVNHIDGNKQNNSVDNLEWCTQGYNLNHAVQIGLVKNQCKICRKVIVKRDEKIVTFETMSDCAKFFGFKKGWLQNRIRKHGLTFSYNGYEIEVERGRAKNHDFL